MVINQITMLNADENDAIIIIVDGGKEKVGWARRTRP